MTRLLLGTAATALAAMTVAAAPAAADPGVRVHYGNGGGGHGHDGNRHHRRNDIFRDGNGVARGDATVISEWYGGQWALYNNRSFAPDSYNDWWHDNPQRSYPRWMQNNQNCQRQWWSGGGWTC